MNPRAIREPRRVSNQVQKLNKLIYVHPALEEIRKSRNLENPEYGKFSVDMSPLRLLKNIGNMYLHNSNCLREDVSNLYLESKDSGDELDADSHDTTEYKSPPRKHFETNLNLSQNNKNPIYVNYVNKNGEFMNIHEKIDDEISMSDTNELNDLSEVDQLIQKETLDQIIQRISENEREMKREYENLQTHRVQNK